MNDRLRKLLEWIGKPGSIKRTSVYTGVVVEVEELLLQIILIWNLPKEQVEEVSGIKIEEGA